MAIPSGYTALDFVGFTDKGTYANNITYVKNDLAHYGGDIWKCLVDNTIGVTPSEGVNWTLWIGAPTNLVERIIAPLETNPATVAYAVGRQIIYDDWLWEVIAPIAVGDSLIDYAVDPTNANIKKSPSVETQVLAIKNGLGTAAAKDFTTSVTSGSADLVTSGAVYSEVDAVSTALTTKLSIADLTSISDCDDLPINSIAFISNSATAHLPWAVRCTIITCEVLESPVRKFQVAFTFNNEIYIRNYLGSWESWKLVGADMGNNIAPIENGTNYSTSYTKGEQFINNGLLCEVTASSVNSSTAISIGGAGNAKYADSITKQLKETMNNPLSNMKSSITKIGNVKYLEVEQPNSVMTYNVSYDCGTLPVAYRPTTTYNSCNFIANTREYELTVNGNGTVSIKCLTNALPSSGKPVLHYVFTFI